MRDPKPWWESTTLWANGLMVVIALAGVALEQITGGVLPFEPDAKWVAVVGGLVNIVLRLRVNQTIRRGD